MKCKDGQELPSTGECPRCGATPTQPCDGPRARELTRQFANQMLRVDERTLRFRDDVNSQQLGKQEREK